MSFSFSFAAGSPEGARRLIREAHAPECVRDFLIRAVDSAALRMGAGPDKPVGFHVSGAGHLCDGAGSYEISEAHLSVRPFVIVD